MPNLAPATDAASYFIRSCPELAARMCFAPDYNHSNAWSVLEERAGTSASARLVLANGGTVQNLLDLVGRPSAGDTYDQQTAERLEEWLNSYDYAIYANYAETKPTS